MSPASALLRRVAAARGPSELAVEDEDAAAPLGASDAILDLAGSHARACPPRDRVRDPALRSGGHRSRPADGQVIYVREAESGKLPVSDKHRRRTRDVRSHSLTRSRSPSSCSSGQDRQPGHARRLVALFEGQLAADGPLDEDLRPIDGGMAGDVAEPVVHLGELEAPGGFIGSGSFSPSSSSRPSIRPIVRSLIRRLQRRPLLPRQAIEPIWPPILGYEVPLELHAELLHDSSRRGIFRVMHGDDAVKPEPLERLVANRAPGLRRVPLTPG